MVQQSSPAVAVVMGSDSDLPVMQRCVDQLKELGIDCQARVISAHRTPDVAHEFAATAAGRGVKVIIAAAGMSAALAGVLASQTSLPVIGVPMISGPLGGVDAALSTMQMPPGVPVACMSIGPAGATNAAILAAQILALGDTALATRLADFRRQQSQKVIDKDRRLQEGLGT